jgi:hypothetical protein
MQYETDVTCPACQKVLLQYPHDSLNFNYGMDPVLKVRVYNVLEEHEHESPQCARHERWQLGPDLPMFKVDRLPIKTEFSLLPKPRGQI